MNRHNSTPLFSGIKWMMLTRLILLILATTSYIIKNAEALIFPPKPMGVYITLVTAALINLLYLIISRHIKRLLFFAQFQIIVDICITTTLVYLTGGLQGNFVIFYIPSILAASIMLGRRASIIYPTICVFLLSFHVLAYKQGFFELLNLNPQWLPGYTDHFSTIMASLLTNTTAFYLIAILSSYLSRGLKEAQLLSKEYAEITPDALVLYDTNGVIVTCNSNFSSLCQQSAEELQGIEMNNAPEPCPTLFHHFSHPTATTKIIHLHRQESTIPFEAQALPLIGSGNQQHGTVLKLSDLTHYQETQKLKERNQSLEVVREMSSSIAHEIRNPLAAMRGAAAEIRTHIQGEEDKLLMEILLRELDRLDETVGSFMNMARLKKPRIRHIDLRHLIEDSITMLKQSPEAEGKIIKTNLTGELMIDSDADYITQILINLGKNALQAMSAQDIYCIRAHDIKPDLITLEISDTGKGIPEKIQDKIFSPFFSTKSTGSGLGLPMVAQLIDSLGGTITVRSKEGETVFTLLLPKTHTKEAP